VRVLVVLSCFGIFASTVAVWTHRTVYNTDAWVKRVDDLPKNPEVAQAMSTRLTAQLFATIDAQGKAADALPPKASFLAAPLTTAVEQFLAEKFAQVIQTDQFQQVWIAANRFAHEKLIAILKGKPGAVQNVNGKVYLNLLPIMSMVLDKVHQVAPDLVGGGAAPPEITKDTPPDQARQELSDYLGRPIPEDFGQILIFKSNQLEQAQTAMRAFSALVVVTVLVTLVLIGLSIGLALDRRRTIIWLGLGTMTSLIFAWALARVLSNQVIEGIKNGTTRQAARQVAVTFTSSLRWLTAGVIAVAALVVIIAFVVGDSSTAISLRRTTLRLVGRGAEGAEPGTPSASAAWVAHHQTGLRVLGLVLALLAMALVNLTWASFLIVLVLFAFFQLVVEALNRASAPAAVPSSP
jgi:hypothetical protein